MSPGCPRGDDMTLHDLIPEGVTKKTVSDRFELVHLAIGL